MAAQPQRTESPANRTFGLELKLDLIGSLEVFESIPGGEGFEEGVGLVGIGLAVASAYDGFGDSFAFP